MALNPPASISTIRTTTGFGLDNQYCVTGELINAVVNATYAHLKANAHIIVNSGAGGTYPVIGVNESALASEIMAQMPSFYFEGQYSKADVFPKAVASAVSFVILTKAKVSVPTLSSGAFKLKFVIASDLSNKIESYLISRGFDTSNPYAKSSPLRDAIANELARALAVDAVYLVNGTSGGVFYIQ